MTTIAELYHIFRNNPVITTDSRNIEPDSLFFALKGDSFNGNKFAIEALNKGAVYAIIDEKEFELPGKTILVENVLQALKDLASLHRKKLGLPILAITGTNGKTTTKELVSAVLARKYNVSFTQGNLNNHIGVPLTLLKMNESTEFGVVEMGANHPGEIAELCEIADPDYGIITNIGKAHLEGFGSFEGVIQTKTELYRFLQKKNGLVFYNKSNPLLEKLTGNIANKISYGENDANLVAEPIESPPYLHLKANFPKGVLYLNTQLTGNYNFENVLAAACIGNYFMVDPLEIQKAIKVYQPKNNRSQLIVKNNLRITMDAYNANPTSMQASIKSFMQNASRETNLILGDMLELGEYSRDEHTTILELLKSYPECNVYLVGDIFFEIAGEYDYPVFENADSLCETLKKTPITNGNVLIKGSRGIHLEKVLNCF
ncbi:MAG: UDP-N-acetylmuramoyl-tripeptide--D-alanyl-D-alanine ligase [Draconibacterium sp.]